MSTAEFSPFSSKGLIYFKKENKNNDPSWMKSTAWSACDHSIPTFATDHLICLHFVTLFYKILTPVGKI